MKWFPFEQERPFLWRTGAALADFNGDGLIDLITHDGYTREATLFARYRHLNEGLGLRKDRKLRLVDGSPITDAIVSRQSHWTESFRAVDWDGIRQNSRLRQVRSGSLATPTTIIAHRTVQVIRPRSKRLPSVRESILEFPPAADEVDQMIPYWSRSHY